MASYQMVYWDRVLRPAYATGCSSEERAEQRIVITGARIPQTQVISIRCATVISGGGYCSFGVVSVNKPSACAFCAASTRERLSSLARMLPTNMSTVRGLRKSS